MTDEKRLTEFVEAALAGPDTLGQHREQRAVDAYVEEGRQRLAGRDAADEEEDDAEAEDQDDGDDDGGEDDEATAFWASLTPAQSDRAEADEGFASTLFEAWQADQEAPAASEGEGGFFEPATPEEFIDWVRQNEAEVVGWGWEDADDLIAYASTRTGWEDIVKNEGWSGYEARPRARNMPGNLGLRAVAAAIPGARVVAERLHAPLRRR